MMTGLEIAAGLWIGFILCAATVIVAVKLIEFVNKRWWFK